MNKIKEEISLSLIFVAKWLLLGLGALGIVYLAIGIAYDKSYYEPRMKKFDYEISEVIKKIDAEGEKKIDLITKLEIAENRQLQIQNHDLPNAEAQIERTKKVLVEVGAKCWLPGWTNSDEQLQACRALDDATNRKEVFSNSIEALNEEMEDLNDEVSDSAVAIGKLETRRSMLEHDKEAAKADMKGIVAWLLFLLGASW